MSIKSIVAATLLSVTAFTAAEAMPLGAVEGVMTQSPTLVDYECGRGFHVNPWGYCVRWDEPPPPPPHWGHGQDHWGRPPPPEWNSHRGPSWDRQPPPPWTRY